MTFDKPRRPEQGQPQRPNQAAPTQRPQNQGNQPRRNLDHIGGGGGGNQGNNRGGGNQQPPQPSPWLDPEHEPKPAPDASFVEYLRWMREPGNLQKDGTKVQILQMAEEKAKYDKRLKQLTDRTLLIAGKNNCFQVKCTWRMRVGGHRGPESILLPAFDALGMPFIPSSTLRGVARTQAIRELMAQENLEWEKAEKLVTPWFGFLETANKADRAGKVIFLDAYPLPGQHGLLVDMANNIWNGESGNDLPQYRPNPNPFFSLKEPTFFIGLRLASGCDDPQILAKVKQWLIKGLQAGIGSQVNTGYGEMLTAGTKSSGEFFRLEFQIEGQLIHGRQKFTQWNWNDRNNQWQMRGQNDAEVRPTAFKSMLRYWFRMFALGYLNPNLVKTLESELFGAIQPKNWGYLRVNILQGKVKQKEPRPNYQGKDDPCGEQMGILTLSLSPAIPNDQKETVKLLMKNLTWLMFHLGGIGQGARRPCYSRKTRPNAPWYRGCNLIPDSDDNFWKLPETPLEFQKLFQQRLRAFYKELSKLVDQSIEPNRPNAVGQPPIEPNQPNAIGQPRDREWYEAVDSHCRIVVCSGAEQNGKPYALGVLHSDDFKVDMRGRQDYDGNLCGKVTARDVKPSPVWVVDLGDYQVVTVFGATVDPRQRYLGELKRKTDRSNYYQIWPLGN